MQFTVFSLSSAILQKATQSAGWHREIIFSDVMLWPENILSHLIAFVNEIEIEL